MSLKSAGLYEHLTTAEEWIDYLRFYEELYARLQKKSWFHDGWRVQFRHVPAGNRVIFILTKDAWCEGDIHFKTRLTNTDLQKGLVRVGLHVETSIPKHGINRIIFDNLLLERSGDIIQRWDGYVVKPTHYQKPFHTWIPFTRSTLVSGLEEEFSRVQQLGPIIDAAIQGATTAP